VRQGEYRGCGNGGPGGAGKDAHKAEKKISLQEELLREGPDSVAAEGQDPLHEAVGAMERVEIARQQGRSRGHENGDADDPDGTTESSDGNPHRFPSRE